MNFISLNNSYISNISKMKMAMSADGTYQTVVGKDSSGNLYITYSKNKGSSWNISTYLSGFTLSSMKNIDVSKCDDPEYSSRNVENDCQIINISDNGANQLILFNSYSNNPSSSNIKVCLVYTFLLISSNYGESWSLSSFPTNLGCLACSISSTGKYQSAGTISRLTIGNRAAYWNDTPLNGIYYSQDYGNTWKQSSALSTISYINLSMSSDGSIQKAMGTDGYIYTSIDFGKTWTQGKNSFIYEINFFLKLICSIGISGDTGQYQTIFQSLGSIFVSNDYGNTWYRKMDISNDRPLNPLTPIFISNTGQYQQFIVGNIKYYSNDYGDNWQKQYIYTYNGKFYMTVSLPDDNNVSNVDNTFISKDGNNFLFVTNTGSLSIATRTVVDSLVVSPSTMTNISNTTLTYSKIPNDIKNGIYLITCTDKNIQMLSSPTSISKIEQSGLSVTYMFQLSNKSDSEFLTITYLNSNSNCSIFLACGEVLNISDKSIKFYILKSTDAITWTPISSSNYQYSGIVSDNNGKNWTAISNMNITSGINGFSSGVSIDATRITNYNIPDTNRIKDFINPPKEILSSLCISPDGTKQAIITSFGSLFVSTTPGNWKCYQNLLFCNSQKIPLSQNNQITMDDSGKYISISQENLGIFVSSDGGITFKSVKVPISSWKSIKMSSTGKYQIAVSSNSGMYMSNDFGQTWTSTNIPCEMYIGCTISSSGQFFTVASSENIYQGKLF